VQADIATKVAAALNLALTEGQQTQLGERPTENLAAYDAYLRGLEIAGGFAQTTGNDIRRALGQFDRALALDSTFALAWAYSSRALSRLTFLGGARADERVRARTAAERSLELAPHLAAARLALGEYYYNVQTNWRAALEQYTQARQLAPRDPDILVSLSRSLQSAGRWNEALTVMREAQSVDPRSIAPVRALAVTLLWMRKYEEALGISEKAILLSPEHPAPRQTKAMIYLAQGDLGGARKVVSEVGPADPTAMVVYMAQYWDLFWALDDQQQQLVLRLPVGAFDGDVFGRANVFAELYDLRGDAARSRAYADTAADAATTLTRDAPSDPYLLAQQALALAYQGRKAEAMKAADRSLSIQTSADDAYSGTYNEHLAARVYLRCGKPDKALDILEHLVKIPYYLSPAWLKIDPEWKPLHGNPRFEKLTAGTS
jgi:tetratricopeptide (TPR) repeat protein